MKAALAKKVLKKCSIAIIWLYNRRTWIVGSLSGASAALRSCLLLPAVLICTPLFGYTTWIRLDDASYMAV
jgi:hypothetical protein